MVGRFLKKWSIKRLKIKSLDMNMSLKELQKMAGDLKEVIIKIWKYADRYYGVKVFYDEGIIAFKVPDPMQQHGSEEAFVRIQKSPSHFFAIPLNKEMGFGCDRSADYFRITRKEKGGEWFFRLNDKGEYYPLYGRIPSEEEFAAEKAAIEKAEIEKKSAAEKTAIEKEMARKIAAQDRKEQIIKENKDREDREVREKNARREKRAKEYDENTAAGEEPRYCSRSGLLEWSYKVARKRPSERVISREDYIDLNY